MFEDSCAMLHERNGVKFANKKYPREQVPTWIILDLHFTRDGVNQRQSLFQKSTDSLLPTSLEIIGSYKGSSHLYSKLKINLIHYLSFTQASVTSTCGNLVFFCWKNFRGIPPHLTNHVFVTPGVSLQVPEGFVKMDFDRYSPSEVIKKCWFWRGLLGWWWLGGVGFWLCFRQKAAWHGTLHGSWSYHISSCCPLKWNVSQYIMVFNASIVDLVSLCLVEKMCKPAQDGHILATDGVITNLFKLPKINGFHQGYFTPISVEVFSTFSSFSTRHRRLLLQWRGFSRRVWKTFFQNPTKKIQCYSQIRQQMQDNESRGYKNIKVVCCFFCGGKTWCFARIWRSAGFLPPNKLQ